MTISAFDRANVGNILAGHGTWFTADLLRLCAHADTNNLAQLRRAFPDVVDAYVDWRECRVEPSDDELYNRTGVEGGIGYTLQTERF